MGGKRKGLGATGGAIKKPMKVPKKKPEETEEEKDILAIKITANTAIRQQYHASVLPWIKKLSIEATKTCELASLLFLNHVRKNHEEQRWEYFENGDGMHVIEECFFAVLSKYVNTSDFMLPEFKAMHDEVDGAERMAWPNNFQFGNLMKYFPQQYAQNVKTNLTTHQKKRLAQFFRCCVINENRNNPMDRFDENDVKNAVSWAIKRYDSTRGNAGRLHKRNHLLALVRNYGGPDDDDIARFTRDNWFQSLPMWLDMQWDIDLYNNWQQQRQQQQQRRQRGARAPILKNLSVIPICTHMRKAIKIDADVLYRLMCASKTIPKDENGRQVTTGYVCKNKEYYFNEIFNMEKINRILKANKEFHCHVVSDGESASILYKVSKKVLEKMEEDGIVKKRYYDGSYVYEIGIDPGMKTWLAVVRRDIVTGKEVSFYF